MSEVMLPPWIIPEEEPQEPLDEGSSVFRAAFAPGLAQRQSYGGLRLKLSRRHTVRGEEKARLLSVLRATKGCYNALRTKVHFALRGSFPAAELLTNNTFSDGTTGWTAYAASSAIAVADRTLRLSHVFVDGAAGGAFYNSSAATVVAYAPYVARAMRLAGSAGTPNQSFGAGSAGVSFGYLPITSGGLGLVAGAFVPYGTSVFVTFLDGIASGITAGAYIDIPYVSLSRCALVDTGPNSLQQSDAIGTSPWTATGLSSVSVNAATAPDGTLTADTMNENGSNSQHLLVQNLTVAGAAGDYAFSAAVLAGNRSFCRLQLNENTGSTGASAYFNLSTGAVGTTAVGANWSNIRAFIVTLGGGWRQCVIVARKTNAATSVDAILAAASADNVTTYTGGSFASIHAWRATVAQSSVPTRLSQTTSVASTGSSPTGNALHVKGLPASTNGLLLPEDIFEINGELKTCTSALNSDAAGLGYLQFEPALVRSPADNDPIIILDPMGKFLVSNIKVDNEFGTQARVSYDLEHIYE